MLFFFFVWAFNQNQSHYKSQDKVTKVYHKIIFNDELNE